MAPNTSECSAEQSAIVDVGAMVCRPSRANRSVLLQTGNALKLALTFVVSGEPRCGPTEHRRHPGPIDVLAAQNYGDTTALEPLTLLDQRREGRGSGTFSAIMRSAEQDTDGIGDLVFRDFDYALGSAADDVESSCIRHTHGHAIRKRERALGPHNGARRERQLIGICSLGHHADYSGARRKAIPRADQSANAGAEPDRNVDRVEELDRSEKFVGVGCDPEHEIPVERSDEFQTAVGSEVDCMLPRLVEIAAVLDQLGAKRTHGCVLLGGVAVRYDDGHGQ